MRKIKRVSIIISIGMLLFLLLTNVSGSVSAQWTSGGGITSTTDNVGIGIATPTNKLDVAGNMAIGVAYAGSAIPAPSNGLLIEGTSGPPPTGGGVGIGVPVTTGIGFPAGQLHVDLPNPNGAQPLSSNTIY